MIKNKVTIKRKKTKQSGFIRKNIKNYLQYSTPKELFFDLIIPLILAIFVTITTFSLIPSPRDLAVIIQEINGLTITITAILAGFNTASLAIIASSGNLIPADNKLSCENNDLKGIKKLKNLIMNNPSRNAIEAVVSFFSYAVISQLIILVFSLLLNVILSSLLKNIDVFPNLTPIYKMILLSGFSVFWIFLILHSIFLSIRNIDIISNFVKFHSKL